MSNGHGTPDWDSIKRSGPVYAVLDLIDAAIRSQGQFTFDRRGNVVWAYDFHNGLGPMTAVTTGTNADVYPTAYLTRHGGLALSLRPGDEVDSLAGVRVRLPIPVLSGLGLEVSFTGSSYLDFFGLRMDIHDGTTCHRLRCGYKHQVGEVRVLDDTGTWRTIGTPGKIEETYTYFSTIKFVVDTVTDTFQRVILNGQTFLATDYTAQTVASSEAKCIELRVFADRYSAGNMEILIDDMLFTQNEPLA